MLISQLITDVRRELLETTGAFWSDAELLRHYNRAIMAFVDDTRILEDKASLSLIQGRQNYPLPANWLSARLVMLKTVDSSGNESWLRLSPSNLEKTAQERSNFPDQSANAQTKPNRYYIWGKEIYVIPAPDADSSGSLYLWYKSKPIMATNTDQSVEIDDALAEGLTSYILWKAWKKEKEIDLAEEAQRDYLGYVSKGRRWVKKQSGDQRYRIDIDSPIGINRDVPGFDPFN